MLKLWINWIQYPQKQDKVLCLSKFTWINVLISRYIPRDSVRVGLSLIEDERDLAIVGFERPDGGVAIVVLNR